MVYSLAQIGAAVAMKAGDYFQYPKLLVALIVRKRVVSWFVLDAENAEGY